MTLLFAPFVYLLSWLLPKKKHLWCFGSWFGQRYDDNTKFLYEEALLDSEIEACWVTANVTIYDKLKLEGKAVVYATSLKGIWTQLRAKVFVCTVNSKDFYFATITRRNFFIQTWHGAPLKQIGFDVKQPTITKVINYLRWFLIDNYSLLVSPSSQFDECFISAMKVSDSQVIRSQNARCDGFLIDESDRVACRNALGISDAESFVLFMPTHRNEGKDVNVILNTYIELLRFNGYFGERNIKIVLKLHPYDLRFAHLFPEPASNVLLLVDTERDLYSILASSDALITDYSSVMFEYKLLNKAIHCYVPDLKDYMENQRGLYFKYADVVQNPIYDIEVLIRNICEPGPFNCDSICCEPNNVGNISFVQLQSFKSRVLND